MAIGSEAGEGDSDFSIIKPRVSAGLNSPKSVLKSSVHHALAIEALVEAGLDEVSIFQGIMSSAYVLESIIR